MQPIDISEEELVACYEDINVQADVVNFIGLLKFYEKTGNEDYLIQSARLSADISLKLPYDEVTMSDDDGYTFVDDSPSALCFMAAMHMRELDLIPEYKC